MCCHACMLAHCMPNACSPLAISSSLSLRVGLWHAFVLFACRHHIAMSSCRPMHAANTSFGVSFACRLRIVCWWHRLPPISSSVSWSACCRACRCHAACVLSCAPLGLCVACCASSKHICVPARCLPCACPRPSPLDVCLPMMPAFCVAGRRTSYHPVVSLCLRCVGGT